MKSYDRYAGPKAGFVEEVYTIVPLTDRSGRTLTMIKTKSRSRRIAPIRHARNSLLDALGKTRRLRKMATSPGSSPAPLFQQSPHRAKYGAFPNSRREESHYMTIDFAILTGPGEVAQVAQTSSPPSVWCKRLTHQKPAAK